MYRRIPAFILAAALLTGACSDASESGGEADDRLSPMSADLLATGLDFDSIAARILDRLDLQPGEKLFLVAVPGRWDALVDRLREGAIAAGAEDLGAWTDEGEIHEAWVTGFVRSLQVTSGAEREELLRDIDAAVMLPGATASQPMYAAIQDQLWAGRGRTVHFHWEGAYDLDGVLRSVDPSVDAFYQRVLRDTDYEALGRIQRRFEEAMRGAEIHVTTPQGTDLRFRIGDRPVTRQDGDASAARAAQALNLIDREVELPAGAIRVAPIEESVNGRVAFPPSVWNGTDVEGLILTIENGRVVDQRADLGLEAAVAEMDAAGPAGRAFREFALGFNPLLAIPEADPWIPYYGYGAGVVRLSLGDNTELGGAVGGGYVRWNFFTDASVTVDGIEWVRDGRLVTP